MRVAGEAVCQYNIGKSLRAYSCHRSEQLDSFTHVPMFLAASKRKKIDPEKTLWSSVLASTGRPWDMR